MGKESTYNEGDTGDTGLIPGLRRSPEEGNGNPLQYSCLENHVDGDCSHEIKRHVLFVKKTMTNLDSILTNRDITLPTKVCIVKAMVFPTGMYKCESWTIKKAESRRIDAFEF